MESNDECESESRAENRVRKRRRRNTRVGQARQVSRAKNVALGSQNIIGKRTRDQHATPILEYHAPDFVGKTLSSSSSFWSQDMTKSI